MSPILKRDIHEQLRQAKRLALATAGRRIPEFDPDYEFELGHGDSFVPPTTSRDALGKIRRNESYASGSNPRQGIGVDDIGGDPGNGSWREDMSATSTSPGERHDHSGHRVNKSESSRKGKERLSDDDIGGHYYFQQERDRDHDDGEEEELEDEIGSPSQVEAEKERLVRGSSTTTPTAVYPPRIPPLPHFSSTSTPHPSGVSDSSLPSSPRADLRNLVLESTAALLFSLIGIVFTGELLEHLARWRVFRRVDELFILVPMLGNLKGNLEMCLSARLGTSANIGELDHRRTRRALLVANMTLLGLQALLISCLAGLISFVLGLITIHRLGDTDVPAPGAVGAVDPGLAVGEQEWHEGYTRPGWKQLVMVLATGMGAAGMSSAVLGSFMSSLIVVSRWFGIDPDNITPPVASCLGDLLTLFLLALIGTGLVGVMDTPVPLIAVIVMAMAAGWFTKRVWRNEWVRSVARGGWVPLIGAMCISSGTGMVLDTGVGKYRGFALLAISMTGLTGSIGAIHANRLSTSLHTGLHPASLHPRPNRGLDPVHRAITLYAIAFPCQMLFLGFVTWAGWIDLSLGWAGWLSFALTSAVSLVISHHLTLFFWSKDLDPDSYTLPIHSALVDFIGQCLLMLAYEICISLGKDVQVRLEGY